MAGTEGGFAPQFAETASGERLGSEGVRTRQYPYRPAPPPRRSGSSVARAAVLLGLGAVFGFTAGWLLKGDDGSSRPSRSASTTPTSVAPQGRNPTPTSAAPLGRNPLLPSPPPQDSLPTSTIAPGGTGAPVPGTSPAGVGNFVPAPGSVNPSMTDTSDGSEAGADGADGAEGQIGDAPSTPQIPEESTFPTDGDEDTTDATEGRGEGTGVEGGIAGTTN